MAPQLPPRGHLVATGPVDAIDRYYEPIVGRVLRQRLFWVWLGLPRRPIRRTLEIGYGSGVFQFSLAPRVGMSVGIDIHRQAGNVKRRLAADGIQAELLSGDGMALPFADGMFDVVLILSALEFVPDPGRCLAEAMRVLDRAGRVILVCPRILRWADALYRTIVGFDPEREFNGGRQRVQQALATIGVRVRRFPRPYWLPPVLAPYELIILEHER